MSSHRSAIEIEDMTCLEEFTDQPLLDKARPMARSTNWQPPMSLSERDWFDKVPKSVLFEIARQFAMLVADDHSEGAAIAHMAKEWEVLKLNGLVPQKPAKLRTDEQIVASWPEYAQKRYLAEINSNT